MLESFSGNEYNRRDRRWRNATAKSSSSRSDLGIRHAGRRLGVGVEVAWTNPRPRLIPRSSRDHSMTRVRHFGVGDVHLVPPKAEGQHQQQAAEDQRIGPDQPHEREQPHHWHGDKQDAE